MNAEFEVPFRFSILKISFDTGEMKAENGPLLIKTFHFDLLTCLVSLLMAVQLKILFIHPHLEFHVVVLCPPAISLYNAIHLFEVKIVPSGPQSGNQRTIILPQ